MGFTGVGKVPIIRPIIEIRRNLLYVNKIHKGFLNKKMETGKFIKSALIFNRCSCYVMLCFVILVLLFWRTNDMRHISMIQFLNYIMWPASWCSINFFSWYLTILYAISSRALHSASADVIKHCFPSQTSLMMYVKGTNSMIINMITTSL